MSRHVLGSQARELVRQEVRDDLLGKLDPPRASIGRRFLGLLAEFCFGPAEKRLGRRG
ncbi:MAG: hypothetical protein JNG85_11840 [Spirochaetaceae bacterium]|nr:hypothetical protein [Spirochaetaceae bacterium]